MKKKKAEIIIDKKEEEEGEGEGEEKEALKNLMSGSDERVKKTGLIFDPGG